MITAMLKRFNAYRANPDPFVAAANTLALVLAGDGPFYPVSLFFVVGKSFWPSLIDLWVVPLYALIPAIGRRHPRAAIVLLVVGSIANTALYTLLFGARAHLQLFMLPCILLGLFFPRRDRILAWSLAALALALFIWLRRHTGAVVPFGDAAYRAMATLSEISVATLTWFLLVLFGGMVHARATATGLS